MEWQMVEAVKGAYKEKLKQILAQEHVNFQAAKKDVIEAEGRMVTRYDSTKTEVAWLANGHLAEIKALEKEIERVYETKKIHLGDTVTVRVPLSKGESEVATYEVSKEQPEGYALLGRLKGDMVEVEEGMGSKVLQIVAVKKGIYSERVDVDTLVRVKDAKYGEEYYFITEGRGGILLELEEGVEVIVINLKSPLAQKLLGEKAGMRLEVALGPSVSELTIQEIIGELGGACTDEK